MGYKKHNFSEYLFNFPRPERMAEAGVLDCVNNTKYAFLVGNALFDEKGSFIEKQSIYHRKDGLMERGATATTKDDRALTYIRNSFIKQFEKVHGNVYIDDISTYKTRINTNTIYNGFIRFNKKKRFINDHDVTVDFISKKFYLCKKKVIKTVKIDNLVDYIGDQVIDFGSFTKKINYAYTITPTHLANTCSMFEQCASIESRIEYLCNYKCGSDVLLVWFNQNTTNQTNLTKIAHFLEKSITESTADRYAYILYTKVMRLMGATIKGDGSYGLVEKLMTKIDTFYKSNSYTFSAFDISDNYMNCDYFLDEDEFNNVFRHIIYYAELGIIFDKKFMDKLFLLIDSNKYSALFVRDYLVGLQAYYKSVRLADRYVFERCRGKLVDRFIDCLSDLIKGKLDYSQDVANIMQNHELTKYSIQQIYRDMFGYLRGLKYVNIDEYLIIKIILLHRKRLRKMSLRNNPSILENVYLSQVEMCKYVDFDVPYTNEDVDRIVEYIIKENLVCEWKHDEFIKYIESHKNIDK